MTKLLRSKSPRTESDMRARRPIGSPDPQTENVVNHEAIARLAYKLWEARSGEGGSPEEDWLRAERELKANSKRDL